MGQAGKGHLRRLARHNRGIVHSESGASNAVLALALLIVAAVAGGFIARDWAAFRHVAISSPGQYADAAFRAIADRQYWGILPRRIGSHATGASMAAQPTKAGSGDRAEAATGSGETVQALAAEIPVPAAAHAVPAADDDESAWNVGYITDPDSPISDRKILVAQMSHHDMAASGHIDVQATCADGAVNFEFDSFGSLGKDASFDYAFGQSDGSIFVVYRIDAGPQLLASNLLSGNHDYTNVVNVAFAEVGPDYKPVSLDDIQAQTETAERDSDNLGTIFLNAMKQNMTGIGALYGAMTPRDIEPLLHARLVRFQLALQGGAKEIIALSPQESSFQEFLAKCGIDTGRNR